MLKFGGSWKHCSAQSSKDQKFNKNKSLSNGLIEYQFKKNVLPKTSFSTKKLYNIEQN